VPDRGVCEIGGLVAEMCGSHGWSSGFVGRALLSLGVLAGQLPVLGYFD